MRCVARRELAEEITADAFLQLHQNWESIDTGRLPSWLLTVVKNRAADHWRRIKLEQQYLSEERPAEVQTARPRASEPLSTLFDNPALKPVHRICLTLRYVQEMSVAEIAAYMGLSEMQVKGHLQSSRTLVRKQVL